jgi:hypothetical protein
MYVSRTQQRLKFSRHANSVPNFHFHNSRSNTPQSPPPQDSSSSPIQQDMHCRPSATQGIARLQGTIGTKMNMGVVRYPLLRPGDHT